MPGNRQISKTDWKRVEAMTDAEIVYDEDTGQPTTSEFIKDAEGFVTHGLSDFKKKVKEHAEK